MMQQIRKDSGGSLVFDPPQDGRPSSATFTLYKPGGSETIGTTGRSATIDAVNTTLSASASAGDLTVTLADASGVEVGRYYLLTATADGESEWVRAISATSAGVVGLAEPLRQDYASADTFVGNRLTLTVAADDADTLDEGYEARITYTTAGAEYETSVYYDVVRQPWPDVVLTPAEFQRLAGALSAPALERLNAPGLQFVDEIENATEIVREDIIDRGMRPDLFRDFSGFKRPIALRVLLEWALDGVNIPAAYSDNPEEYLERQQGRYDQALTRALNTAKTYDADDDAAVSAAERERRWGTVRMTR